MFKRVGLFRLFILSVNSFADNIRFSVGEHWAPYIDPKESNGGLLIARMNKI